MSTMIKMKTFIAGEVNVEFLKLNETNSTGSSGHKKLIVKWNQISKHLSIRMKTIKILEKCKI